MKSAEFKKGLRITRAFPRVYLSKEGHILL